MLIQLCDKTMILTLFYIAYCTSVRHTKKIRKNNEFGWTNFCDFTNINFAKTCSAKTSSLKVSKTYVQGFGLILKINFKANYHTLRFLTLCFFPTISISLYCKLIINLSILCDVFFCYF